MSCAEFTEWIAYSRIEPFGEVRQDWRVANATSIIAHAFGAKVSAEDCMLRFSEPETPEMEEQRIRKELSVLNLKPVGI